MKTWLSFIVVLLTALPALSQGLDDWVESSPYPEELSAWLEELHTHPLNLNVASSSQIALLPSFDSRSASRISDARRFHPFFSIEEVVRIAGLNEAQRNSLIEFASVDYSLVRRQRTRVQFSGGTPLNEATNLNGGAVWSKTRADFRQAGGVSGYVYGRHLAGQRETLGDVEAGVELRPANSCRVLVGDFQHEAGSGLVFGSAYGMSNWLASSTADHPSRSRGLSLRPSTNRLSLLRGIGIEGNFGTVDATVVGSWSRLDAAIGADGADRLTGGESSSSLSLAEARADQVEERLMGFSASGGVEHFQVGAAGYRARYSPAFSSGTASESLPELTGRELKTGSIFASADLGPANVLTEFARSQPGGSANQSALSFSGSRSSFAVFHTYAGADFFSPRSKAWASYGGEAGNANTTGIRMRAAWPSHWLAIHAYSSRTPFRTESSPLRKTSSELELRWSADFVPKMTVEFLAGRAWNETTPAKAASADMRSDQGRVELRFRAPVEYRMRLEIRSAKDATRGSHDVGTLIFAQAKSKWDAYSVFGRVTLFNFSSDAVTMQPYENSPIGSYPLAVLSGTGSRVSLMLSREWRVCSAVAKVAVTRRTVRDRDRTDADLALGVGFRP